MKKKFVVAVAAVVMAAVMSVSAFAADDVKVPSITGDATGPASEILFLSLTLRPAQRPMLLIIPSLLPRAALPIS